MIGWHGRCMWAEDGNDGLAWASHLFSRAAQRLRFTWNRLGSKKVLELQRVQTQNQKAARVPNMRVYTKQGHTAKARRNCQDKCQIL